MSLSVIIVNYQAWDKLSECLNSLKPLVANNSVNEVLVVDNASPTNKLSEYQQQYPSISFLSNSGNNGFANGCNLGASLAKGDTFLFLNPDTIINDEAITGMSKVLRENKGITILSCEQTDTKGKESKAAGFYKQYAWSKRIKQSLPSSVVIFPDKDIEQVDWVSGSVVMISKADFEKHKGWNEDYWMYCEDEDFCRRVNENGGTIALLKGVSIIHAHGGSSRINTKTAALTKTEVIISTHVYFHNFLSTKSGWSLNLFIAFNKLAEHFIFALLSIPFFFIKKLRIKALIFLRLVNYYSLAIFHRSWLSPMLKKNS